MTPKPQPAVLGLPLTVSALDGTLVLAAEQEGATMWIRLRRLTSEGPGEAVLTLRPFHAGELHRELGRVLATVGVRQ